MSRFSAIRSERGLDPVAEAQDAAADEAASRPGGRSGKKAISGYFSPEMSRALNILAIEHDTSLQALMGEAFDDLLRKYGRHPFGER